MTCSEFIISSTDFESGSQTCALSRVYEILCCPTRTTPNPAEDFNVAAPTETPTEIPTETRTVAAMTPAPTPSPVVDIPVATTMVTSALGAGTGGDNPCIICPDGTAVGDFAPYADDGDLRTCADLIDEAKLFDAGSYDCGWFEFDETECCFTPPQNPCIICPNGDTAACRG